MAAQRRTLSPAPSGEWFGDELSESVINEILLRVRELPESEASEILLRHPFSSILGLLTLSKPWLSPVTSTYSVQRWGLQDTSFLHDPPLALLLQNHSLTCTKKGLFLCSGVSEVKISGFSLRFLPALRVIDEDPISVMGSSEDLLLCRNRRNCYFYVVNPISGRWIALPLIIWLHKYSLAGFVCQRASITNAREGGKLAYRVAHLGYSEQSTECTVTIFWSESWRWEVNRMKLVEGMRSQSPIGIGVACRETLYWLLGCGKVIGLDVIDPMEKGIQEIQNASDGFDPETKKYALGNCGGKLRMSEAAWSENGNHQAVQINVWELEEQEAKWILVQKVSLRETLAANFRSVSLSTLAFHPTNKDIVYLCLKCNGTMKIICCDMKKKSLKIDSEDDVNESFGSSVDAFPLRLPLHPTPVTRQLVFRRQ